MVRHAAAALVATLCSIALPPRQLAGTGATPIAPAPLVPAGAVSSVLEGDEAPAVTLARLRAQWRRALVEHHGDRAQPELRAAADALTLAVWPMLRRRNDDAAVRAVAPQIVELLAELHSDALGELLRGEPLEDSYQYSLLHAYLRAHEDAALAARIYEPAAAPPPPPASFAAAVRAPYNYRGLAAAVDMARSGRAHALPTLEAAALADGVPDEMRDNLCRAALQLDPDGRAAPLARTLLSRAHENARHALAVSPACAALFASMREARPRALRWIAMPYAHPTEADEPPMRLGLALGLATAAPAPALAALARVPLLVDATNGRGYFSARYSLTGVSALAPLLPVDNPVARRALAITWQRSARFRAEVTAETHATWIARLHARDPGLFFDAADALRDAPPTHVTAAPHIVTLLALGGGTPVGGGNFAAIQTLLTPTSRTVPAPLHDAALRAVERTSACGGDHACLSALLEAESLTAMRALVTLGPEGLSSLPEPSAHALVRRLLLTNDEWLLAVALATVRGCPRSLRGLVEASPLYTGGASPLGVALIPWAAALQRACSADER